MARTTADTGTDPQPPAQDGTAPPARRRRRVWRVTVLVLLTGLLALGGGAWWMYQDLNGNLDNVDLDRALGGDRPGKQPAAGRNILLVGSDSRAGENAELDGGKVAGARSDTALVIHLPPGGERATAVSIPRDTLVTRPACTTDAGRELPEAERVMFNSVYGTGGPACVVRTVEALSGIRMDHYVEIDFAGFREVVDALGGVTVTTREPIADRATGLRLDAGTHRLDGEEALRFVRTRYGVGDGSDLGRIELQQQFLTAVVAEVRQQGILTSPAKLYRVADAATEALTTDSGLGTLTDLADFGRSLEGVDPATMETLTLPVRPDARDPNRVVTVKERADAVWQALRDGTPVPEAARASAGGEEGGGEGSGS
ncbi:LCP family protein [Streptomyces zingiberis]|uniref:LytR family transcriptional regulator n=1 Tax=Streptomyces zingiberis TaxID=2053010 RepID=A0ABX1BTM8_9ACTN|nr:LCP family protein [Streptomyces zingiberis]NJQ01067.1 LytR family transcriptional regulator [Streptomyces zingiberis]